MSLIDGLTAALAPAGLRLRRAQPREGGRLTLELVTPGGGVCAGQWHSDPGETARIAADLLGRFDADDVELLDGGRLVVQRHGADRRLRVLRRIVRESGAVLVAHRPERRAVVQLGPDRFVKVVRPGRIAEVVPPPGLVVDGLRIPQVLDADDEQGTVTMTTVNGRTLLEVLAEAGADADLAATGRQVGAALRSLHACDAASPRPAHDRAAEFATARRPLAAASRHGLLDAGVWEPLLADAAAAIDPRPPELALLHRDLHDKQVILEPGSPVGLVDLDLVAPGDPALDLANLAVHLDLRAQQQVCSRSQALRCLEGVLLGYVPDEALLRRLPAYARVTRLRLAGLYSFRRVRPGLVDHLLRAPDARTLVADFR